MILTRNLIFAIFCLISYKAAVEANDLCAKSPYSDICVKLQQKFYLIDGNAMLNWFEAERLCRRQNGYLATIKDVNELNAISNYLVSKNYLDGDNKFWIGASDLGAKGKTYSVETGNLLTYTKWSSGQPNFNYNENCVDLAQQNNNFLMHVSDCNNKLRYVCELQELYDPPKKLVITYHYA